MVSSIEGGQQLPQPLINMEAAQTELRRGLNPETGNIIGEKLPRLIGIYQGNLRQDGINVTQKELAQIKRAELEEHIKHLDILAALLREFNQNPMSFDPTVNNISTDDRSFSARFKRKTAVPMGNSMSDAQTQINFFVKDMIVEDARDTARAVGLQGKDQHSTMEEKNRQMRESVIQINTIGVFLTPDTRRAQLLLQGGLMIHLTRGKVTVSGFKYVGTIPHEYDLGKTSDFSVADFNTLRSLVMRLSGKPAQTPKPRKPPRF